jgi:tetratricopeptide repeat protein 30
MGIQGVGMMSSQGMNSTAPPISGLYQVPEGKYTSTIYTFIKDGRYLDVIKILSNEMQTFPKSRAALSLLGYCYYQIQDYSNAATW